jgi:hypothetical protein
LNYTKLTLVLLIAVLFANAQPIRQPVAAAYTGLGAYSMQQQDVFAFTNNQAALAQVKSLAAGVYAERRYMAENISMYTAALAMPTRAGNFGINVRYFGFTNFNEYQAGLAYGRSLGKKVDVGVQFNYYGYRVPGNISAATVNAELGAIFHLTDKLNAGVHVYNPIGGVLAKTDEKISAAYKFGLGYDASDKFFVTAELVKEESMPVNLNMALQYRFVKQFFVRGGVNTGTNSSYAGAGMFFGQFRMDIAAGWHPQLGLSPGLLFIYNFAEKDQPNPAKP